MYYCASEKNVNENIRKSKYYTLVKGNLCSKDLGWDIKLDLMSGLKELL